VELPRPFERLENRRGRIRRGGGRGVRATCVAGAAAAAAGGVVAAAHECGVRITINARRDMQCSDSVIL